MSSTLALFDFDGTITTCETMPDFVKKSISAYRFRFAQVALTPVVLAHRCGIASSKILRNAVVQACYKGASASHMRVVGAAYARDHIPCVLREEAVRRIAWHKDSGHTIAVVSGALDYYLAPWCKAAGLELICSSLDERDGILTGRYQGEQCLRQEKARRVCARYDMKAYQDIYAYGDSPEDNDLLDLANKRFYRWQEVAGA
jgi:HAD superfamily hydrolase (TIGR01490 family)